MLTIDFADSDYPMFDFKGHYSGAITLDIDERTRYCVMFRPPCNSPICYSAALQERKADCPFTITVITHHKLTWRK
jgi:hypothetical protein